MDLLVVESPGKVKKLQAIVDRLYGAGAFAVAATVGHFRGLPKMAGQAFGDVVDLATFRERYVVQKPDILTRLAALVRRTRFVYLATDADREGEAIAWHLVQELKLEPARTRRVLFTEINERALREAIDRAGGIDGHLVDAQRARQVLDYLMGLELSRRLWRFGARSAGRVQSAAVRIVVDRDAAIRAFTPHPYVTLHAHYHGFDAVLAGTPRDGVDAVDAVDGIDAADEAHEPADANEAKRDSSQRRLVARRFLDRREAAAVAAVARVSRHEVETLETRPLTRRPPAPFTTATLQAAAAVELAFEANKTAQLAQRLFEQGLITYVRTDSTALAAEAVADIRAVLRQRFPHLLPPQPQVYADKRGATANSVQGAHEAIRPVDMNTRLLRSAVDAAADTAVDADADARELYELIWWRTLTCQASNARFDQTTLTIRVDGIENDRFIAVRRATVAPGFLALTRSVAGAGAASHGAPWAPTAAWGRRPAPHTRLQVDRIEERGGTTRPPPRFTEATLTLHLQTRGIGRPATYAPTLTTIVDRGYVRRADGKLEATAHGVMADTLLRAGFDVLTRAEFTASCERSLDAIADGTLGRVAFLQRFHGDFSALLQAAGPQLEAFAAAHPALDRQAAVIHAHSCRQCGAQRLLRGGRNGRVAVCSNDACGSTELVEAAVLSRSCCHRDPTHGKMARIAFYDGGKAASLFKCLTCGYTTKTQRPPPPCPLCRSPMRTLDGPRGPFWGCSAFRTGGCRGSAPKAPRSGAAPRHRAQKRRGSEERSA
ncbi:MAG: type IA DNA topoisomerase [Deltaproteobacteria bacterium]|nr:type IA DNA topoisomerase [Deltaproteobacteria bacterium]